MDGTHTSTVGCAGFAIEHLPREHNAWDADNFGFDIEAILLFVDMLSIEFANVVALWASGISAWSVMLLLGSKYSPFRLAAFWSHGQQHSDQHQQAGQVGKPGRDSHRVTSGKHG